MEKHQIKRIKVLPAALEYNARQYKQLIEERLAVRK